MDRIRGEGGQTNGQVFGAFLARGTVANPLARLGENSLPGGDDHLTALVLHLNGSAKDDRVLIELRPLAGLDPTAGGTHVGDAYASRTGVDAAHVLIDELGLIAGGGDPGGLGNELGHCFTPRGTTSF